MNILKTLMKLRKKYEAIQEECELAWIWAINKVVTRLKEKIRLVA